MRAKVSNLIALFVAFVLVNCGRPEVDTAVDAPTDVIHSKLVQGVINSNVERADAESTTSSSTIPTSAETHVLSISPNVSPMDLPKGSLDGNRIIIDSCHVELVYCKDPRFGLPSFCFDGCDAGGPGDPGVLAGYLCQSYCGDIRCDLMVDLLSCH